MRRKHGAESRYYHIRLRDPKQLKNMRTVKRGPVKQVVGKNKKNEWVDQNILVEKKHAHKSGSRLVIKNKSIIKTLKEKGITVSSVVHDRTGGEMDYKIKKR